jgi:hypothetical protein
MPTFCDYATKALRFPDRPFVGWEGIEPLVADGPALRKEGSNSDSRPASLPALGHPGSPALAA